MQEHTGGHPPGREEPGTWNCEGQWGLAACGTGRLSEAGPAVRLGGDGKDRRGSFPEGGKSRATFNKPVVGSQEEGPPLPAPVGLAESFGVSPRINKLSKRQGPHMPSDRALAWLEEYACQSGCSLAGPGFILSAQEASKHLRSSAPATQQVF